MMRLALIFLCAIPILLLGCTILPPEAKSAPPPSQLPLGPTKEQLRAAMVADFQNATQGRNETPYKAQYAVNESGEIRNITWYSNPPSQERVDVREGREQKSIIADGANGYRCDTAGTEQVCYRLPPGSIEQFRPEPLKFERAALEFPEVFDIIRGGESPQMPVNVTSCLTIVSTGSKLVACYVSGGIPAYARLERAGEVSEVVLQSLSEPAEADFAQPAQIPSQAG